MPDFMPILNMVIFSDKMHRKLVNLKKKKFLFWPKLQLGFFSPNCRSQTSRFEKTFMFLWIENKAEV